MYTQLIRNKNGNAYREPQNRKKQKDFANNFHWRKQMEKPTTGRTWSVIACFSSAYLKEDRERHSEEQSSSQIWEAETFDYCNGRQDYIPTAAPAVQGVLPESNTNLQVKMENPKLDWLMLLLFGN